MIDPKFTVIQEPEKRDLSFASQQLAILPPLEIQPNQKSAKKLIFLHTPKTGGTNLHFLATAISKTNPGFKYHRFGVPRKPNISPSLMYPNWIGGLEAARDSLKADPHFCDNLNMISGHFPFGLHQEASIDAQYVVLIREPIERALSITKFDNQRGYLADNLAADYLLEAEIDNPQTRMLAGPQYMDANLPCNEETLAIAQKNIEEHFLLAGVTEDTNTLIQTLTSIQGWGPVAVVRSQVTGKNVITESGLSETQLQKLTEKVSIDKQLYAWAKVRWQKWKDDNILSKKTCNNEKYMCITHEFANSQTPFYMTKKEILRYNKNRGSNLINVTQNHVEVKPNPPGPAITTHFKLTSKRPYLGIRASEVRDLKTEAGAFKRQIMHPGK